MTREELKQAALSLPYEPGVYLMKNAAGTVIYVGKAKKLKNRVSQYFQDTAAHNAKNAQNGVAMSIISRRSPPRRSSRRSCSNARSSSTICRNTTSCSRTTRATPICASICARTIPSFTLATRVTDDGAQLFRSLRKPRAHAAGHRRHRARRFRLPGCTQEIPARHRQGTALPELIRWTAATAGAGPACTQADYHCADGAGRRSCWRESTRSLCQ